MTTSDVEVVLCDADPVAAGEVISALRAAGCESEPLIAETQTFIYASRVVGPAQAKVFAVKNSVSVAALPAYRTGEVLRALREA